METMFRIIGKIKNTIVGRTTLYLEKSTIHGLNNIADREAFLIERVFWLAACSLGMFGTYVVFQSALDSYNSNPLSIATETTFLDWQTPFPAVYVCENSNNTKMQEFTNFLLGNVTDGTLFTWMLAYTFYNGKCTYCYMECVRHNKICNTYGIEAHAHEYFTSCEEFITNCTWNGRPFRCCDYFEPVHTEAAFCYVINSMHNPSYFKPEERWRRLPFSNLTTGPGALKFNLTRQAKVYIRSPEETLFITPRLDEWTKSLLYPSMQYVTFKATVIVNDPLIVEVPIAVRQCVLQSENPSKIFKVYGFTTCVVECRLHAAYEECGCVPHIYAFANLLRPEWNYTVCGITGLNCLDMNFAKIFNLQFFVPDEIGLDCDCLPSCDEIEFAIPTNEVKSIPKSSGDSTVTIAMDSLSNERFVRNVVRTKLDLVVSMGGAAGLFLGASLLSIVEIIYYCFIYRNRSPEEVWYNSKDKTFKTMEKIAKQCQGKDSKEEMVFVRKPIYVPLPGYYPRDFPDLSKEPVLDEK